MIISCLQAKKTKKNFAEIENVLPSTLVSEVLKSFSDLMRTMFDEPEIESLT